MIITQNKFIVQQCYSSIFWRVFLVFVLLCPCIVSIAQTEGKSVNELWQEYDQAPNDSVEIAKLAALAGGYVNVNLDSALLLGNLALERAQLGNYRYLEGDAYISLGEVYDVNGLFEPALENIDQGLKIFLQLKSDKGSARAYNARGLARFYANRNLEMAKDDFLEARKLAKRLEDYALIAKIDHNLGQIFHRQEDYPDALQYYLLARNLKDSLIAIDYPGITSRDQISTFNNLGAFYSTVYQFDQAREMLKNALKVIPEEDYRRKSIILYTLGTVEERDSSYEQALVYLQKSLESSQQGGFSYYQPNIYDVMGNSYLKLNSREAARDHYLLALDLLNTTVPKPDVKVGVLAHQGELFYQEGRYLEAIENANEAFTIAEKNDNVPIENIRDAHEVKAKASEALGDFPTAAFHFRKLAEINKEIESEEHKKQYVGLQAIMDVKLNTNRYELKLTNQALDLSKKWVFWLKIASAIAAFLAILFAVAKIRETRAKKKVLAMNQKLETMNIEQANTNQKLNLANNKLRQFSFATGHDLKESLRNITSFTQLATIELAQNTSQAQTHLQEATASGKRMRKMLDDLLHYSNLGGSDTTVSRFPLDEAISSVKQQLKSDIEEARGDVHLTTPATLKANRTEVEQIFFNLVHNGLRYQDPTTDPRITIKAEDRDGKLVFMVCDNGIGIPSEHQQNIFNPFVRLHNRSKSGSGLGLAICRTIIENYGGEIWYEPHNESGSCFCFTLPKAEPKAQLNANLFIP